MTRTALDGEDTRLERSAEKFNVKNMEGVLLLALSCVLLKLQATRKCNMLHASVVSLRQIDLILILCALSFLIQGPVSRKFQELFRPEKPVVKLQSSCFEKLIF